ncbi:PAS domain-containing protein [Amycolatopsis mediterranei]|uniref:PAS domain-containing protein n=1 Tax=Amycolatopsis mediterranei TaxID=33910 RepID=UPI003442E629
MPKNVVDEYLDGMGGVPKLIDELPIFIGVTDRWLRFVQVWGRLADELVPPGARTPDRGPDLFTVVGSRDPGHPAIAPVLAALSGTAATYQLPWAGRRLLCHVRPVNDAGHVVGTNLVVVDVTELHTEQRRYHETRELLASLVESMPTMVVVHDEFARISYANPSFLSTVHKSAEQVLGLPLADLLPQQRTKEPYPLGSPGGYDRRFIAQRFPVPKNGEPGATGIGSVLLDVTEAVQARTAAIEAEERYRAVTDSVRAAVATVDLDACIQQVNPAFTHLLGRTQAQARGKPITLILDPAGVRDALPLWQDLIAGRRRRYDITLLARKADGRSFPADLTVTLVRAADGLPQSAVGILTPVTMAAQRVGGTGDRVQLTEGEGDVLVGLASGNTVPHLAKRLHLTKRGVDYRIQCIRRKLRNDETVPATIGALVARAYAVGLLRPDCWPPQLAE